MQRDDARQTQLATAIQAGVPLETRPYARIAENLGIREEEVLQQLRAWRDEGKLREISAVLEGSALGYESALVAARVPEPELYDVVTILNGHPTITHNYLRNHAYNLWFTLATPLSMGIEPTLKALSRLTGVPAFAPLRRTETFKIGVNFDLNSKQSNTTTQALQEPAALTLSDADKRCFRALQSPLPYEEQPFRELADAAGVDEVELLRFGRTHLGGALRRYVATFRHRKLGVKGNGMAVWSVPSGQVHDVGRQLAAASEVSHCYARETTADFPYNIYSMIHGPDEQSCLQVAHRLSRQVGIDAYVVLFSVQEFKKTRLRYFLPELDAWWAAHAVEEAR